MLIAQTNHLPDHIKTIINFIAKLPIKNVRSLYTLFYSMDAGNAEQQGSKYELAKEIGLRIFIYINIICGRLTVVSSS